MTSSRFARPVLLALGAVACLALPGCLQNEQKLTLRADGSGTVTEKTVFEIENLKAMLEMGKMMFGSGGGGMPGEPVPEVDVDKALETNFGEVGVKDQLGKIAGVEAKAVKSEVKDGKRTTTREYTFTDLSTLGLAGFAMTGVDLKKNADGTYTLEFDSLGGTGKMLGFGTAAKEGAPVNSSGIDLASGLGMIEAQAGGLSSKRTVVLPGEIVETNGTKGEDGKTVSFSFVFKDLQEPPKDGVIPGRMFVKFKGENLTLKPFTYRPNLTEIRERMLRPPAEKPAPRPSEPGKPAEPAKPGTDKPVEPGK